MAAGLRVCADPDNLPYSNSRNQGFENELARLVGREMARPVTITGLPSAASTSRRWRPARAMR